MFVASTSKRCRHFIPFRGMHFVEIGGGGFPVTTIKMDELSANFRNVVHYNSSRSVDRCHTEN
jgi:hypothetical protein